MTTSVVNYASEVGATDDRGVDLDQEDIRLPDGSQLPEARAEEITQEGIAEMRRRNLLPGRKSLSGGKVHSPRVLFRVSEDIREQAERVAEQRGIALSRLAREALEKYLKEAS